MAGEKSHRRVEHEARASGLLYPESRENGAHVLWVFGHGV
jgi:hypothetical protein